MLLLLCAFVWGSTFVAQSTAAQRIPTFTFLASRSYVGGGALLLIAVLKTKRCKQSLLREGKRHLLVGGLCGAVLFIASACQQYVNAGGKDAKLCKAILSYIEAIRAL